MSDIADILDELKDGHEEDHLEVGAAEKLRKLRRERGKLAADLEDMTTERNEFRSALRDLRKLTKRTESGRTGQPAWCVFRLPNVWLARVDALLDKGGGK